MLERAVTTIVVTRNRKDVVRESLAAVRRQTHPVVDMVVVDNGSADGTPAMLDADFPEATVVALTENRGVAGGLCEGFRTALGKPAEWLWLLDDDSIPREDALAELLAAVDRFPPPDRPVLVCSRVEWTDGRRHPMNWPIFTSRRDRARAEEVRSELLPVRASTWVSTLVSRAAVERAGMPELDFFYQTEDIEYTARVLRDATGYYVPSSIVEHRTETPHTAINDDRRFYFHVRNTVLMLRGRAWRLREKPRLVWLILQTSYKYLRINHLRPRAIRNLLRGLAAGVRRSASPSPPR